MTNSIYPSDFRFNCLKTENGGKDNRWHDSHDQSSISSCIPYEHFKKNLLTWAFSRIHKRNNSIEKVTTNVVMSNITESSEMYYLYLLFHKSNITRLQVVASTTQIGCVVSCDVLRRIEIEIQCPVYFTQSNYPYVLLYYFSSQL